MPSRSRSPQGPCIDYAPAPTIRWLILSEAIRFYIYQGFSRTEALAFVQSLPRRLFRVARSLTSIHFAAVWPVVYTADGVAVPYISRDDLGDNFADAVAQTFDGRRFRRISRDVWHVMGPTDSYGRAV